MAPASSSLEARPPRFRSGMQFQAHLSLLNYLLPITNHESLHTLKGINKSSSAQTRQHLRPTMQLSLLHYHALPAVPITTLVQALIQNFVITLSLDKVHMTPSTVECVIPGP